MSADWADYHGCLETDFYLLAFTFLTRKSLCEIRYRDGDREVAAFIAYEYGK
ncbi:Hok/Gef family protein [Salmonella enterica subsp. diarizonae serovar 47:k:z53:[z84]]|nr:Hok/Gef family protein [Salmonella enterica subsp. diarizonae serovar 47:k:z53:[z84]]